MAIFLSKCSGGAVGGAMNLGVDDIQREIIYEKLGRHPALSTTSLTLHYLYLKNLFAQAGRRHL